jgi:CheY-like chemotaxis protein
MGLSAACAASFWKAGLQHRMNGTVLVVDDDPDIQEIVSVALEEEGYRVLRSVDGASVSIAAREQPQLVLLDLNMPGMDGTAVSRYLRGDPSTSHIPIVVMSAASSRATHTGLIHDDWLYKPFDLDDLFSVVARWVKKPVS